MRLAQGELLVTAAPTLSPAGGTFNASQTVTLADATPSATIYYTTDGTTPTTASTKYTVPIVFTATTTLKFIAVAPNYAQSAVRTVVVTVQ